MLGIEEIYKNYGKNSCYDKLTLKSQWLIPIKVCLISDIILEKKSLAVSSREEIILGRHSEDLAWPPILSYPLAVVCFLDSVKFLSITCLALHGAILWEALPLPRSAMATAEWSVWMMPSLKLCSPEGPFPTVFNYTKGCFILSSPL